MSWTAVLTASGLCLAVKAAGYVVPARWVDRAVVTGVGLMLPVSLLAALAVLDTATSGSHLVADARLPAMAVAGVAVWRKAPFVVVVVLAALTAALWRVAFG
ncbi:MAG TPA: AzlD domain-containing protein [Acidimicrobiales bacterium]|nr:AzlD domain-containing protein [Acidimicrobiales bacterium]